MPTAIDDVLALPAEQQIGPLLEIAGALDAEGRDPARLVPALLAVLEQGCGPARQRVSIGEVLARLGDPRLCKPSNPDYFVPVRLAGETLLVGRFPVTTSELADFVDSGGYDDDTNWSPDGLAWKATAEDTWPTHLAALDAPFKVANQPAVYANWYEAEAYANANGARLPTQIERLHVMRGETKRPYPWGAPFGSGNANTVEEVLKRPCAVGLYPNDATPEGVMDLAGNVAEWLGDEVVPERIIHPGAWSQPSMAAWAKARFLIAPTFRGPDLGFRLVRGG